MRLIGRRRRVCGFETIITSTTSGEWYNMLIFAGMAEFSFALIYLAASQ